MRLSMLLLWCACFALTASDHRVSAGDPTTALARLILDMREDAALWRGIDRNNDDALDAGELALILKTPALRRELEPADADGDGIFAAAELQAAAAGPDQRIIGGPRRDPGRVQAQVLDVQQTAYVRDYDVVVDGEGDGLLDPQIDVVQDGTVLGISGLHLRP